MSQQDTAPVNGAITPLQLLTQLRTETNTTVTLPAVLDAIELTLAAAEKLARVEPGLRARVARNRARSRRARLRRAFGMTNGHGPHVVKLTSHGLMLVCRCCGRAVAR